jgi:hypothetical protein
VNEARARLYQRLMEAEDQIAHALQVRGVSPEAIDAALDAIDEQLSEDERREDLYLSALDRYVTGLGGRLEVHAVFDDQTIVISRRTIEET